MAFRLENLRQISMLNYRLIESLENPDENLITVALIFAELDHTNQPGITDVVDEHG